MSASVVVMLPRDVAARADPSEQSVLKLEKDGLRYEFHVLTGRESLYDVRKDPHGLVNLVREREADAASLRRALESQLGIANLESLRARHGDAIRRLQALGYL